MYNINISSHTDVGDVKKTNQDSILVRTGTVNGHSTGLFIVADGCGGLEFGEEISNLITTHFSRIWNDELSKIIPEKKCDMQEVESFFDKALYDVNDRAIAFGEQVSGKVGSTVSLLFVVYNKYIIKNIGDSRVYLQRGKMLSQITEDQSLVAELVRSGEITKEEAKNYKKKNVLTMCVGMFEDLKIHSRRGVVKNGDTFLLCCDGIHNQVSPETVTAVLKDKGIAFENKAYELRRTIPYGSANDNVSAVICQFYKKQNKKKLLIGTAIAILIILLAAGLKFYYGLF